MKNIEKYIMVILIFIAVGAIGAAVYFGINTDKDNKKVIEVSNGQLKKITFAAGEEITLKTTSKIQKLKMETIDSTGVINKFLINGKEIYKNVLGGIDETVYIYNNIIIISDFGTDIRGNSLLFFDFNGNKIKEITTWGENKLLYWINGGIPDVADSYLVYVGENNNLIVEFPFTAVTHGPTITTTTNEVNEIVLDNKTGMETIKNRLKIADETIIEGTAKLTYKGDGKFSDIEIVEGTTLFEYVNMIIKDKNEKVGLYSEIKNAEVRNIFTRLKNVFSDDFNNKVNAYNDFSGMMQDEIILNLLINLAYEENFEKIKTTKDSSLLNDEVYNYFCKDSNNNGICGENGVLNLEDYCDIYILPVSKLKELYKEVVGREIKKEELQSIEYYRYFDYHEEDELFYIVQPGGGGGDISVESLKVAETEKQITINYIISSHPDYHGQPWENEFKFTFIKSSNGNWYFDNIEVIKVS